MRAYRLRHYRSRVHDGPLAGFQARARETDLHVRMAPEGRSIEALRERTLELILKYRGHIEDHIASDPAFARALSPVAPPAFCPRIIREMIHAGQAAGVGPMAAVAGAMAEAVGRDLLAESAVVTVENGGDVFLKTDGPATLAVFAGRSPFSMKIGVRVEPGDSPMGVCTSSGTVGHSLSMGRADAACVLSRSCSLADAVATAAGNLVQSRRDIEKALAFTRKIPSVMGALIILGDAMGAWGALEVTPLSGKKG